MPDPTVTPPATDNTTSSVHSTPLSQGSGANIGHHKRHTKDDYEPYLLEDLKSQIVIPWQTFLDIIIPGYNSEVDPLNAAGRKKFHKSAAAYCSIMKEESRYKPLTDMLNLIVESSSGSEMVFCRNDPTYMWGSPAERKPDILGVHNNSITYEARDSVDNLSEDGPKEAPFHWSEAFLFIEVQTSRSKLKFKEETDESPEKAPQKTLKEPEPEPVEPASTTATTAKKDASKAAKARLRSGGRDQVESEDNANSEHHNPYTELFSSIASSNDPKPEGEIISGFSDTKRTQCASYALELLSYGGFRRHVLGTFIHDGKLVFLYYDHSGLIASQPFNWLDNLKTFRKIFFRLANLDYIQLGFEELFDPRFSYGSPPYFPKIKGNSERLPFRGLFSDRILQVNHLKVSLQNIIYQQHGIIGRGTKTLWAKAQNGTERNKVVVVKFGYIPDGRSREAEIIMSARQKAASDNKTSKFLKHLPMLYASTRKLASELQIKFHGENNLYEMRNLEILVSEELKPITLLKNEVDMGKAFWDIFQCHYWLYKEVNVLHCDISLGNLMYRKDGNVVCGVLNDFDLSRKLDSEIPGPSSRQRTGTLPFVALDLLKNPDTPPAHIYRYDVESLFYVFYYVITSYVDGMVVSHSKPPLSWWFKHSAKKLRALKITSFNDKEFLNPTSTFIRLADSAKAMFYVFRNIVRDPDVEPVEVDFYKQVADLFEKAGKL